MTRSARFKRLLAVTATSVAVLLAAACTANTGGGTGNSGGGGTGGAGGGNQPTSAKYLSYSPCCSWNATWSYNPYNVNGLGIQNDYITMRLAIQKYPSLTDYVPQLADKWTVAGDKFTCTSAPGSSGRTVHRSPARTSTTPRSWTAPAATRSGTTSAT